MRTVFVILILILSLCGSASANWFNNSEKYLAACQNEAVHRYYKDTSSEDVRRHIYLCMIAHGYAFKEFCHEEGWLKPDCYRLKYTSEGVNVPRPIPHQAGWRAQGRRRVLSCAKKCKRE